MFSKEVYTGRRELLKKILKDGLVLMLGNSESAMNYASNQYPFRQDSSFLYYFGFDEPDLAGIIDLENDNDTLYGDDPTLEDIVWIGEKMLLSEKSSHVGIANVKPLEKLNSDICKAMAKNRKIHFLPTYRPVQKLQLASFLDHSIDKINEHASVELIKAIISQRSVKDRYEISEMENTMNRVTAPFYVEAMRQCNPGKYEYEISGLMEGMVLQKNCQMAYPVICSVNGQILHNHYHGNEMKQGDLLIIDAGAESPLHYATDITRTIPVSGKFSAEQKDIYNLVLKTEVESINSLKPGIKYQQVHKNASRTIIQGLKDIGLMKGNVDNALEAGAHALFFPHGLGHMIGLDVHDMENLGEDYVGYDSETKRIDQFGTNYLRLAKELKPGYTLTVEPGIYFIPALIEKWNSENYLGEFIDYSKVLNYLDFGGIRIEDNILITDNGHKIIGNPIAKTVSDVENLMNG